MNDKNKKIHWWLIVKSDLAWNFKVIFNFVFLGLILGYSLYGLLTILRVDSVRLDHVIITFMLAYFVVFFKCLKILNNTSRA